MHRLSIACGCALSILFVVACGDETSTTDAATPADSGVTDRGVPAPDGGADAGVTPDSGGQTDAEPADTGETDGGAPDEIVISCLTATVTVDYDEHSIAHVACADNNDCFAAQGYVHAQQRFGQMDLRRRFVRGRLSELFALVGGDAVLNIDRQSRLFIATRDGERLEDRLLATATPETRAAIDAYTCGVNAWIADLHAHKNGATLTADWPIPPALAHDWEALDTAACMLGLLEDLTNESGTEIDEGQLASKLPPGQFFDLFGLLPASTATILPLAEFVRPPRVAVDAIGSAHDRLAQVRALLANAKAAMPAHPEHAASGFGSNNWIVAPQQTANGRALLANDPHLALENPPIWYVNSLDAQQGDIHVAGVSFVGVPGIILGHNEHIAWGATTTVFDMADVYVETTSQNDTAVVLNGNDVPLIAREVHIERLGFPTHVETFFYVPHHGPVVAADPVAHTAISVHWVGHEADTDLNFLSAMMRATNIDEAQAALRNLTSTGQNFVVADTDGNIGWYPYSRVPQRPWAEQYPPFLPLPGTGEAEWAGFIPYDELPQSRNPLAGYLATANGDMTGALQDGDPLNDGVYLQHFVADGYRQERILERLSQDAGNHSRATMQSIQGDVHSLIGRDLVPPILMLARTATTVDANGTLVVTALQNWTLDCPTGLADIQVDSAPDPDPTNSAGSAGCAAFHAVLGRLNRAVFDDEIAAAGLDRRARIDALVLLLTRPGALVEGSVYWDDVNTAGVETPENVVARALNDAGAYLVSHYGPMVDTWRWGRDHALTLTNGFVSAVEVGPFARDGGFSTINVGDPNGLYDDNYTMHYGSSMRLACELSTAGGVNCTIELPGGQQTFPTSPFYTDLLPLWLKNTPYDLWFDPTEVTAASQNQVPIKP